MPTVTVRGVPDWVDTARLLGEGSWTTSGDGWTAALDRATAADLMARLRGVGLGGHPIVVDVRPPPKRALVRRARTHDARRRRASTAGFSQQGTRLDDEGRLSLTPEALALAIGRRADGRTVVDAMCGCGGNAIGFARAGCTVVAIDADAQRLAMAAHNADVYGVANRITFVHGAVPDAWHDLPTDLLFIDPPWGADWNRLRTDLADLPVLEEVWPAAAGRFAEVWAKVPPSFDVAALPTVVPHAWFGEADGNRRRVKFLLLTR